jgi:2-polyprenyl-3-methyl-5-hydroxy-6-metoxy-1,4-benzoquinol methylase
MERAIRDEVAPKRCLICGGQDHRPVFNESGIDILRCRKCRHVFSSFAAEPHYDGFWGDEVPETEHFYWQTARARMYQDFLERFVAGRSGRLLDMGCGLGFFLRAVERHATWKTYGCEISPAAVQYARRTLGLTNVVCTRLEDADFPPGSMDVITMWDVLDHIPRPDPLLRRCHTLLSEEGMLFIRTPNVPIQLLRARLRKLLWGMRPGVEYLQARNHAHHYSPGSIRRLLARNGFSRARFVHLPPVQGSGRTNVTLLPSAKTVWFESVRALAFVSGGRWNFDNLFVVTQKEPRAGRTPIQSRGPYRCANTMGAVGGGIS